MTHKLLNRVEVCTIFQQVHCKAVTQCMGRDVLVDMCSLLIVLQDLPEALTAHSGTADIDEKCRLIRLRQHAVTYIAQVHVQRLQSISDEDCMKEGIMEGEFMNTWDRFYFDEWGDVPNHITFKRPRDAYRNLIDRISGKGTWQRNPWVYVYEFELVR